MTKTFGCHIELKSSSDDKVKRTVYRFVGKQLIDSSLKRMNVIKVKPSDHKSNERHFLIYRLNKSQFEVGAYNFQWNPREASSRPNIKERGALWDPIGIQSSQ